MDAVSRAVYGELSLLSTRSETRWIRWITGGMLAILLLGGCTPPEQQPEPVPTERQAGPSPAARRAIQVPRAAPTALPSFVASRHRDIPDHWLPQSWYCRLAKFEPNPLERAERDASWERRAMDLFSWDSFLAIVWPYDREGERWTPRPSMTRDHEYFPLWGAWLTGVELQTWMDAVPRDEPSEPGRAAALPRHSREGWRCEGRCLLDELSVGDSGNAKEMLWDQNGEKVHYEIRVNGSWMKTAQRAAMGGRKRMSFEHGQCKEYFASDQYSFEGAVEIKLAWKVLGAKDARERFFTMSEVELPDRRRRVDLGLVGVHITHKSKTQTEWIWSTFEHVDNVRANTREDGSTSMPSFHDPHCTSCCANSVPWPGGRPSPAQLTRTEAIHEGTEELNQEVRAWLAAQGAVWRYYELIGTQYRSRDSGKITPARLRNTVIEPFFVPRTSCMERPPPRETSSCIGCHRLAETEDFSFVPEVLDTYRSISID